MSVQPIDLDVYRAFDLDQPVGQLRAVPVDLGPGQPRACLLIYAEDPEVDPAGSMFFFPRSTNQLRLISAAGDVLWHRDLGPGSVPGTWFCPVFPFDLDEDGVDELYLINNRDRLHPLNHAEYCLERLDAHTGATTGQWPLPEQAHQQMDHTFRYYLLGGHARGRPVLVTGQGTFGPMVLQGWTADLGCRWRTHLDAWGPAGSHQSAVVDLAGSGVDGVLWGERYIELDEGPVRWQADQGLYAGHSDLVQPVLDWRTGAWCLHTCRENGEAPRIVVFDSQGRRLWGDLAHGHIDTGWAAHLGENGEPIVLGVRIGAKRRSAAGKRRTGVEEFTYHAFTGDRVDLGFSAYTTIPVDLNGDGRHELVRGYFEGDGTVLDGGGRAHGSIGGLAALACKFIDHPGEQILSYTPDGQVRIWVDRNARDSDAALRRYGHPFYRANQRLTASGYNLFNLGGL